MIINVVLVIHLILAVALMTIVLLQRSEGGALGIGGGGGMGGFMTGRGTANLLTRATAILAAAFIVTSLALAKLASMDRGDAAILDQSPPAQQEAPEQPQGPSAPVAQ